MKDLVGLTFGKLTVKYLVSCENYKPKWYCECACGSNKIVQSSYLTSGDTSSCGCLVVERNRINREKLIKHGYNKTKEYKAWKRIKSRCCNKNSASYPEYGGAGITIDPAFKENFLAFIESIGWMPDYENRWSVDRIDNDKGYLVGNIRWALDTEQARNKGMYSNNSTGVNGVYWTNGKTLYATASWYETMENGKTKQKSRYFSVKKYGLLPAFAMACKYREEKIAELNALGYGYTDNHGK